MQPQTDQHARIVAAAEAVAGRGENPTLTAVRTELGGGSFSTISPVLRTWKAAQTHDDEPMREPLPARLHEAAIAGTGEIWRAALELAGERLAAERAALDATRVELDDAVTEATATADELATQLEQAQSTAQAAAETAAQRPKPSCAEPCTLSAPNGQRHNSAALSPKHSLTNASERSRRHARKPKPPPSGRARPKRSPKRARPKSSVAKSCTESYSHASNRCPTPPP